MVDGRYCVWLNAFAVVFFVLVVSACSSVGGSKNQTATQKSDDAASAGITEPNRAPRPGASFAWLTRAKQFYDAPRFEGSSTETMLEDAIVDVLTAKGFKYTPSPSQSEFLVGYTVVLGDTLSDAEINAMYEVDPELKSVKSDSKSYEHGTLVIKVFDSEAQRSIWSGSLKGYASLELPDEMRKRRLRAIVEEVLASFPDNGQ